MPKVPDCDRCRFYVHSPYMVCGVNPCGPEGDTCPDFIAIELREPLESGYYGGDWIPQPSKRIPQEQQLALLDWHPLFMGRCPSCEVIILQTTPSQPHWDCCECGWMDDSV